jgi:hypothetical protein
MNGKLKVQTARPIFRKQCMMAPVENEVQRAKTKELKDAGICSPNTSSMRHHITLSYGKPDPEGTFDDMER